MLPEHFCTTEQYRITAGCRSVALTRDLVPLELHTIEELHIGRLGFFFCPTQIRVDGGSDDRFVESDFNSRLYVKLREQVSALCCSTLSAHFVAALTPLAPGVQ